MNGFVPGYDRWLTTPPDEPEAVHCESCGDEMDEGHLTGKWICPNEFCPTKFQGVEKEMAEALVEALDKARDLVILKRRYLTLDAKHDAIKLEFELYKRNQREKERRLL